MTEERPREMRTLARWLGTWKASFQVAFSDGEILLGTMTVVATPMAAGQGIHMDQKGTFDDSGEWEGQSLWGYDADSSQVQWFAVSSNGEVHHHSGVWRDEDTLELQWQGVVDGEEAVELATFRWNSPTEVAVHFKLTIAGKLSHSVEGLWVRQDRQ